MGALLRGQRYNKTTTATTGISKDAYILLLSLSFTACNSGHHNSSESNNLKTEESFALIDFPEGKRFDFGTYSDKEIKTHDILIKNPSKIPLVINLVETFCGCTEVEWSKKTLLEGQTDTIHVKYDGNGFVDGFWAKHIRIHANIEEKTIDYLITGTYISN